jgi:Ca2+-binding RTX toxin-like protein
MALELLERRRLYSVSVVQGYPGYYEVYGTDDADAISISVSNTDATFTLDGAVYGGVSYVSVFAGGGNDFVSVAIDGWGPIGASVVAGGGDDNVSLVGGGAVWGEGGDDTLSITDSFRGEVYGGSGQDRLTVAGACADAQIDAGQGSDLIDATGSAYGVFASGGQGQDTVYGSNYDDQLYGNAGNDVLVGNGGNDVFYTADYERDCIIGGAGIDVAFVDFGEGAWGVEYLFYV